MSNFQFSGLIFAYHNLQSSFSILRSSFLVLLPGFSFFNSDFSFCKYICKMSQYTVWWYRIFHWYIKRLSCWYSDIAMSKFDTADLQYHLQPTLWKTFRDDILTWYWHLNNFLTFLDLTGKIKFTMQVQDEDGIEFLDLKLKF